MRLIIFLFWTIILTSPAFGGELVAPTQKGANAPTSNLGTSQCPAYLQKFADHLHPTVEMLKPCQGVTIQAPEVNDPVFIQNSLAEKFSFLDKTQMGIPQLCASDYSQSCPGGVGRDCKTKAAPTINQITSYYNLQARIHDEISQISREVAYSDQLTGQMNPSLKPQLKVQTLACNQAYGDLRTDCESKTCTIKPDETDRIISELAAAATEVEKLEKQRDEAVERVSHPTLGHSSDSDVDMIESLGRQIKFLESQYPMIHEPEFKKLFKSQDPASTKAAFAQQLQQNRTELMKRYADLNRIATCMQNKNCDLGNDQDLIAKLPPFDSSKYFPGERKSLSDTIAKQKLIDLQCLVDQGKLNRDLNWIAASSAANIGLTAISVMTLGASSFAVLGRAGAMFTEATDAAATAKVVVRVGGAIGAVGSDVYALQAGTRKAIQECGKTYLQSSTESADKTQCTAKQFSRAYRDAQTCITAVVYAALGGAPFLPAIKLLKPVEKLEAEAPKLPKPSIPDKIVETKIAEQAPASPSLYDVIPDKKANFVSTGGTEMTAPVLKYDVEMAKDSGLPVSEIAALRKNFSEKIPETGETGVFRLGDDLVVDSKTNLVNAYSDFSKKIATGKPLTGQDIIDVRARVYKLRSVSNGKNLVDVPLQFKGKFTATIDSEIPQYVQDRLKHYNIKYEIKNGKTTIIYPESSRGPPLDQLAKDINKMVADGHPPERIAAFVAQDLLILHPFKDGNGRTARLMAQAIYKHLTGKDIVFPKQFEKEMQYTVDQLATSIMPPRGYAARPTFDQMVQEAYQTKKVLPETISPAKVKANAPSTDVAFPKAFKDFNGKTVQYSDLPARLKTNAQTLYYGRPAGATIESAEDEAIKVIKYGRGTRDPNPHLDLDRHLSGALFDPKPSGFFSTTENLRVAKSFAKNKTGAKYGVVFLIDPKGAEVLNIHMLDSNVLDDVEQEVVFGSRLNPKRIQAAVIVDNDTGETVKILKNPNYSTPN